jgi:hypothetical protein
MTTFDPKLELAKVECADKISSFKNIYAQYSANFLKGDDSFFKSQFCQAFQAMGTIGECSEVSYYVVHVCSELQRSRNIAPLDKRATLVYFS